MATKKLKEYAAELDIVIEQGSTFDVLLTWTDENAVPIDITGFSARMDIRDEIDDAAVILSLVSPTDIVLGDAAGTIQLIIVDSVTEAFSFDDAVYDLELVSGGGVVRRILRGNITLSKEVTR